MEPSISKEPISSRFFDSEQYQESSSNSFNQLESQSSPSQIVYNKDYVENLRRRFNNQQNEGRNVRNNEKLGCDTLHIHQRLKKHSHPCDLKTLTCLAGCCGRSFERIQVLAFHVSYAHQDFMTSVSGDLTCLLCGKKWTTVRRKIMHLSLAHREIGEEHNSQCMLQVESVIAPNAPKAQRLEKARLIYGDRIGDEYQDEFVEASAEVEEYFD
ncbi:hypothetical protein CRE_25351 [Caenorhabditis remanei]|uniref:C2H2-type domain-containing protein n=1 Tax=Caenorhabditis remanei TaxID=31234 RepID=E3LSP2_CAERE|nr:hypothetical protein CRE_25351 [Caenorhabditis remanei]